jgi:hypothetical protein
MLLIALMLFSEPVLRDRLEQTASAVTTATVSVSPSTITAVVGQNFSINITISGVLDLYGWELRLNWSAPLLDVVGVVEGSFLKAGGSTYFYFDVNATAGRMVVDCTLLGAVPGVTGDGTLATITFNVKNAGESPLNLYDVVLLNSLEQSIPCQATSGYGYFMAAHDVVVTVVDVSPSTVLPGDLVYINVTVQNKGGYAETFNVTVYANSETVGVQPVSLNIGSSVTVIFAWDTSGLGKGDYTISASASIVPGEVDTSNNNKTSSTPVTVLYAGHDVAVTNVKPSKTVVGQGYYMFIAATVKNYGVFNEAFDTTVYANTTSIASQYVTLSSGTSTTLAFAWNTSGFVKGNYTISAYAWPVPGETSTADNNFTDGWVIISMVGDITGPDGWPDGICDMRDIRMVAKLFGVTYPDSKYNPNCDINDDLIIDMKDIRAVAKQFGKTDP